MTTKLWTPLMPRRDARHFVSVWERRVQKQYREEGSDVAQSFVSMREKDARHFVKIAIDLVAGLAILGRHEICAAP